MGIKQHNRLNLSTTVNTISKPLEDIGKGPTKSIVTISKGLVGLSIGYNIPYYFYVLLLFY